MRNRLLTWLHTQLSKKCLKQAPALTIRDADDRVTVSSKDGTTTVNSAGALDVDLHEIIASVGIQNLTDVVEHRITTIVGSRSHMVRFINGGVLQFAYNASGQLIELKSLDLTATISPENTILFALPHEENHPQNQTRQTQAS